MKWNESQYGAQHYSIVEPTDWTMTSLTFSFKNILTEELLNNYVTLTLPLLNQPILPIITLCNISLQDPRALRHTWSNHPPPPQCKRYIKIVKG